MVRVVVVSIIVLALEWSRALAERSYGAVPVIAIGGVALALVAVGWRPAQLGLSRSALLYKLLGGVAIAAVLLLPAAVRWQGAPVLPASLAVSAIVISVGEELAFRGALYAALDSLWGAPAAILGSALIFAAGHLLSHPPAFLLVVLLAGFLLGLWRWACRDLVAPIVGHALADLAL